ncbi:hypothetical protein LOH69_003060, partial [Listeria monocytogenes]|nr:hypothetical protein [Listeria monocytogenes]
MKKKVLIYLLGFTLLFVSLAVSPLDALADSYYTGTGSNRAKCTLRNTYSSKQLKKMGNEWTKRSIQIGAVGAAAALTPYIGKFLASGAGLISANAGLRGHKLTEKGNNGYKAKEYYCK